MQKPILPQNQLNTVRLLTVSEVAVWARVHPKTVYRWIKAGDLNAVQLSPRTFRITEEDVRMFLHERGLDLFS